MGEAASRVKAAAEDARSVDDLVRGELDVVMGEPEPSHPLDAETLDEQASTQMGDTWEPVRRDAN